MTQHHWHAGRKPWQYRAALGVCAACPQRVVCTRAKAGRSVRRYWQPEFMERGRAQAASAAARRDRHRRQYLMEGSFADAANNRGFKRARWRQAIQGNLDCRRTKRADPDARSAGRRDEPGTGAADLTRAGGAAATRHAPAAQRAREFPNGVWLAQSNVWLELKPLSRRQKTIILTPAVGSEFFEPIAGRKQRMGRPVPAQVALPVQLRRSSLQPLAQPIVARP